MGQLNVTHTNYSGDDVVRSGRFQESGLAMTGALIRI